MAEPTGYRIDRRGGQHVWRGQTAEGVPEAARTVSGQAASRSAAHAAARTATGLSVGTGSQPASARYQAGQAAADQGLVSRLLANRILPAGVSAHNARLASRATDSAARHGRSPVVFGAHVDIQTLARVLRGVDVSARGLVVARAINDTMDRFWTQLKAEMLTWTGLKGNIGKQRLDKGKHIRRAHAAHWSSTMTIKDRYIVVTARYFSAKWNRSMPGVAHAAWGKQQTTKHSFMIAGKAPAFLRVSSSQYPIRPVWGPNPAREVARHKDFAQKLLEQMRDLHLIPRLVHHVERSFEVSKGKAGH